jgi:arylsulfatase A-like enzyme
MHISELLPKTAKQMHRLALIRGINTAEDDHGKGAYMMTTGRRQTPAGEYPVLGAVAAKCLSPEDQSLPGHVIITPGGGGGRSADSAYLGPKFSSLVLGNGAPPQNSKRPGGVTAEIGQERDDLRRRIDERFAQRRKTAYTEAYAFNYDRAKKLMAEGDAFDVSKESVKDRDRYGAQDFARHCLLARRLLERGVPAIQVNHSNYDTHNENFDFHLEQLGEFDHGFATFVQDLAERGMLESTLVVVLSEFGRTPNINHLYGRDHWSRAWSVLVGGCGVQPGAIIGKTNANGTEVVDRQVDHGNLFHTYLQALGIESEGAFTIDGRELPIADPASGPIKELLV